MKILSAASEVFPLVKTGGLADVTGALPAALATHGVEMTTIVPGYPAVMAALGEAARTRATLGDEERARLDARQADIFAAFDAVSKAWRGLKIGEALVLEWPTLRRIGQPIG